MEVEFDFKFTITVITVFMIAGLLLIRMRDKYLMKNKDKESYKRYIRRVRGNVLNDCYYIIVGLAKRGITVSIQESDKELGKVHLQVIRYDLFKNIIKNKDFIVDELIEIYDEERLSKTITSTIVDTYKSNKHLDEQVRITNGVKSFRVWDTIFKVNVTLLTALFVLALMFKGYSILNSPLVNFSLLFIIFPLASAVYYEGEGVTIKSLEEMYENTKEVN